MTSSPNSAERLAAARALLEAGRAAEAAVAAQAVAAADPANSAAQALVAEAGAVLMAGDPQLSALELAAAMSPAAAEAQLNLADAYQELDRPADAERVLKGLLAHQPDNAQAHEGLAVAYLSVGMHDAADYYSRRAIALDGELVIARQTLASVLEAAGDLVGARAELAQAYGRRSLYPQPAATPELTVLVLAAAEAGNIPLKHLMPRSRYASHVWYAEFARFGETPPPVDLILNAMGDPDVARPLAPAAQRYLATSSAPLINPPDKVARTRRHDMAALLAGIEDLVVPAVARLPALSQRPAGVLAWLASYGLAAPALVRPAGSHGGRGLVLAKNAASLAATLGEIEGEAYVTAFYDFASPDEQYRKYRMIFIDRQPMPYHLAIAPGWLVHHETSGMEGDESRRAEEMAFLADPRAALGDRALAAIEALGQRLDLDYCGADFSLLPDGRVLLFEANATMLVHPEDPDGPFAAKTPYVEAIIGRFQALLAARAGRA